MSDQPIEQPKPKATLWHTIQTNKYDIIVGTLVAIGVAILADFVEGIAATTKGCVWLTNITAVLSGASKLFAANLLAWIVLSVAWPTLNHFSNHSFSDVWQNDLNAKDRFWAFLIVACVMGIMAALCVSGVILK